jgi:hypothetical protein
MPNALKKGLKVQVAQESAWGTPLAATAIMAGLGTVRYKPDDTVSERDELNGILTKTTGAPDILGTAGGVYTGGYLSFQDVLYLLEAAYGTVTPTAGASTPAQQTRVYTDSTTAEAAVKSMTLEAGGLTECFRFPGAVLASWEFTAGIKGYTMFTATWIAKDMTAFTFTAALSARQVTRVFSQLWTATIDTTGAGLGGTPFTSCITEIKFASGPLWAFSNCINGVTTPTSVVQSVERQPTITLTMKQSAETLALFTTYRAGSTRFIRLKNTGAVAIGATPTVYPSIQIDMAGNLINYAEVGDAVVDNQTTIPLVFSGAYDPTWGAMLKATVVNTLASLP